MVPSAFAESSPSWIIEIPTKPIPNIGPEKWTWGYESDLNGKVRIHGAYMWTDKDYYTKDETVIVNGKFAPSYQSLIQNGKLDSLQVELSAVADHRTKISGINAIKLEQIKINDDGTFSVEVYDNDGNLYKKDEEIYKKKWRR